MKTQIKKLIDQLALKHDLDDDSLAFILNHLDEETEAYLYEKAIHVREKHYGRSVFMRGLIEFTNYCKQNCSYCGIRSHNAKADRYRLSKDAILNCCEEGHRLGYRTFVLQGGEDPYYTDERLCELIRSIKTHFPDCALTLSLGERSFESYEKIKEAGVDRYLLRHETAKKSLYQSLHPHMSFDRRVKALEDLKKLNFQVGAGFMVGLPHQKLTDHVADLRFLKTLNPEMVGIGPYIPHDDTPLKGSTKGSVDHTLILVAMTRLLLPKALLPATTALGTLDPKGREKALLAGANVVMPNLSPINVREKYALYKDKICTGDEAAHCRQCIEKRIESVGFHVDMGRGDHIEYQATELTTKADASTPSSPQGNPLKILRL